MSPIDSLATYRRATFARSRRDPRRPTRERLPSGVAITLLSPVSLAEVYLRALFAGDGDLVLLGDYVGLLRAGDATPTPLTPAEVAARLLDGLRSLPAHADGSEVYADLRRYVEQAPADALDRYALATATRLRRPDLRVPKWQPPQPAEPREPALPHAEVVRRIRARERAEGVAVVTKWAAGLAPGRHLLGDVWEAWEAAREAAWRSLAEKAPGALTLGRTAFYSHLAEIGDVVPGGSHRRYLVIPEATTEEEPIVTPDQIRAEAAAYRDLAEAKYAVANADEMRLDVLKRLDAQQQAQHAAGDRVGALHTQAARLATGTDGAPVDLGAFRAARR